MKITKIKQHHVNHSLDGSYSPTWIPGYPMGVHEIELFEIQTDEGITGYTASPSFAGGFDYENALNLIFTGEDPYNIEKIHRKIQTVNLLGPRPWHLEIALWDIIGKDTGQPIHRLLGGTEREIPVYASTGELQPAEQRIEYIEDRIDEGFEAVKLRFQSENPDDDLEVARRVREEFPHLKLMVDANMGWSGRVVQEENRWTLGEAIKVCRELEEIGGIEWLEEPIHRHNYDTYSDLRDKTTIPLAGGEFNGGLYHFREFIEHGSLDILQPDAMLATGILQGKKVASMAETNGLEFIPHTWTNGIGLAANLHLMAATHARWCEYPLEPPAWIPSARDFILEEPILQEDGFISPPEGPGLGVEIDTSYLE